jgi:hypothetical protein
MTTPRSLQHSWNSAWATAPPTSCSTLRNLHNTIAYGRTCVFAEEDGDALPFDINTACLPWITPGISPAFYSPATACPEAWTAVATQTFAPDGEVELQCCPGGMEGDGPTGCRPGGRGSWPVVECGEADAEENEVSSYRGASWSVTATASITALQLRYQGSDVGGGSATASSTSASAEESGAGGGGGLSTGATAAIATVIPLLAIIGTLAAFLLWRRRTKSRKSALVALRGLADEKAGRPSASPTYASTPKAVAGAQHEIPEWNIEMDATEAEREKLVGAYQSPQFQSPVGNENEAAELGGMARLARKPIAPVEIDSTEVRAEVGDAYLPYRPGAEGS